MQAWLRNLKLTSPHNNCREFHSKKCFLRSLPFHCGCESFKQRIAILRPGGLLPVCPWIAQLSQSHLKCIIRHILEQSLFFKTPYVWAATAPPRRVVPVSRDRSCPTLLGYSIESFLIANKFEWK